MERHHLSRPDVTRFFVARRDIRVITTRDDAQRLARRYRLPLDVSDLPIATAKKKLFASYADINLPKAENPIQRFETMQSTVTAIEIYLDEQHSTSAVWVGGSFANGKPLKKNSDLDIYFGLRYLHGKDELQKELATIEQFEDIGLVIDDIPKALDAVAKVLASGEGVARIDAMTGRGVGVDIHCLGERDLTKMTHLYPGAIQRIEPVQPYYQTRVSFTGEKRQVLVDNNSIRNYYMEAVPIKGIYPDNFSAGSVLVHDYEGYGQGVSERIWMAIVKGYLYHNNGYRKNEQGKVIAIDQQALSFEGFLATLYYQDESSYSLQRLVELRKQYEATIGQIQVKYNLH